LVNSKDRRIRIIIAEEHQLIRKGLVDLIDRDRDCKVVAEVNNGRDLVSEYFAVRPDIVVSNVILPEMNGMEALEEIRRSDRHVKILFMSSFRDDKLIYRCFRCSAMGYFFNGDNSRVVLNSIKDIFIGDYCFPHNMDELIERYSDNNQYTGCENNELQYILSRREHEIFKLLGTGLTSREIADRLLISIKTIEFHLHNLKDKLNLTNRYQLINISTKHNLLYNIDLNLNSNNWNKH